MPVENIKVPDLGDSSDVEVIEILVNEGDSVQENDSLLVLESDKAAMEIPSPKSGVIKKILVNEQMVDQLSRGRLAIVALGDHYEIVPDRVARKIMERDESAIISMHDRKQDDAGEDDPYAGYEIPDDLMW